MQSLLELAVMQVDQKRSEVPKKRARCRPGSSVDHQCPRHRREDGPAKAAGVRSW